MVSSAGCQSWRPSFEDPGTLLLHERPDAVRVTLPGGEVRTLYAPTVRNDSLVFAGGGVPLADVTSVEVRRFSLARTVILAGGLIGLSTGWATAVGSTTAGSVTGPTPLAK